MQRLYFGGEILTLNAEDALAEALVTEGEEILFVGALSDAVSLCAPLTEALDLGGRCLLSGGAYRLFGAVSALTDDYREVPRLLRELGGGVLEWGADADLVALSGALIGRAPRALAALSPLPREAIAARSIAELF